MMEDVSRRATAVPVGHSIARQDPASIRAYDSFSKPHLDAFTTACDKIGSPELAKCKDLFLVSAIHLLALRTRTES
jgi:hypothetical protein